VVCVCLCNFLRVCYSCGVCLAYICQWRLSCSVSQSHKHTLSRSLCLVLCVSFFLPHALSLSHTHTHSAAAHTAPHCVHALTRVRVSYCFACRIENVCSFALSRSCLRALSLSFPLSLALAFLSSLPRSFPPLFVLSFSHTQAHAPDKSCVWQLSHMRTHNRQIGWRSNHSGASATSA